MSFPITEQRCNHVISKRFGLRSAKNTADLKGAAYALDEGQQYKIDPDYMAWGLPPVKLAMGDAEMARRREPQASVHLARLRDGRALPVSRRRRRKKTFPKCNAINAPTLHASSDLNSVIATMMQWVFDCIEQYGPI